MAISQCPVCQGKWGGNFKRLYEDMYVAGVNCDTCGKYEITQKSVDFYFLTSRSEITERFRAMVSHRLNQSQNGAKLPLITSEWVERLLENPNYPSPSQQATNAIRYIGDRVDITGASIDSIPANKFFAVIGSPNPEFATSILRQMTEKGTILGTVHPQPNVFMYANLSLEGWQIYEKEKRGKFVSKQGFMALKFDQPDLNTLLTNVLKPAISELGFELTTMQDRLRTGIIDNLMRERIRDAAFVIADLTHNNLGAYWEAGYAEGLGKPVLYLCEHTKFKDSNTHFDTSHSTTLIWGGPKSNEDLTKELKATLRNSLSLFPVREND